MKIKSVYFDRKRGGQNSSGHWVTIIKADDEIAIAEHTSERVAREFIGLEGGSVDPHYRPPHGDTGGETVLEDV